MAAFDHCGILAVNIANVSRQRHGHTTFEAARGPLILTLQPYGVTISY
jgi:hypothetical protein